MKTFIAITILGMYAYFFYHLSRNDWLFFIASIVACTIATKLIELYKKRELDSVEQKLVWIVVGVPIAANIIPILDLLVMSAASLAYSIYEYSNEQIRNDKTA